MIQKSYNLTQVLDIRLDSIIKNDNFKISPDFQKKEYIG